MPRLRNPYIPRFLQTLAFQTAIRCYTQTRQFADCPTILGLATADAFRYTSGRWLYNEKQRLDERYFEFNITALVEVAAKSIGRKKDDVQAIHKMAEGRSNRVFELTMRNGLHLIARLPYLSTQPKKLAIPSEVATMDLVRRHGVPVPVVRGYSGDSGNPVGAEYIIMDKVQGQNLAEVWYDLSEQERHKVLSGIVMQEAKLFGIPLPAYGSIFYERDAPDHMQSTGIEGHDGRFCIGPDLSLEHWSGMRSRLEIPQGVLMTPLQVLEFAAKKEISCMRAFEKWRYPSARVYREVTNNYKKVDPSEHLANLESFLAIAAHLVPKQKWDWVHKPVLRHPDMDPSDILIDDDCNINYGNEESENLKKPVHPSGLDEMNERGRAEALALYRRRHTHYTYMEATKELLNPHYAAMMGDKALALRKIYHHAREPWEGSNIPLKADLLAAAKGWDELTRSGLLHDATPPVCPIRFEEQEFQDTMDKLREQEKMDQAIYIYRTVIDCSLDGWVPHWAYEESKSQVAQWKKMCLEDAEDGFERRMLEKHWPFDDYDEDE
ncbi:hypothetical protein M409DRAFT_30891 [Zasmidium cellare ATCC 36951]|uniref:Uncharacterized protein n=1 Tax=Zasmidium cellare ATCC 36951 TaxID=1080233 RepID=A0A6A6BV39_ZASCE|nr:uncharacterized protein M409DRAFT_30891 [Zasmidium cellare ATCC 36951]KAF2158611.1 hypothetical protein M409DRAFT_30891 [Zasmidium cellare ATCC 36951]